MNDAFPGPDPRNPSQKISLMMRLERNYIDEAAMQAKVDEKIARTNRRARASRNHGDDRTKCCIPVWEHGSFQQYSGPPPEPEEIQSVMMKRVVDFGSSEWAGRRNKDNSQHFAPQVRLGPPRPSAKGVPTCPMPCHEGAFLAGSRNCGIWATPARPPVREPAE